MKKLTLFLTLALAACQTPRNPQAWMEQEINACMPTAIAFRPGLRESDVWAEVFTYRYYDYYQKRLRGHAMVAYMYPPGTNQLWTYDQLGSYRTRAFKNDVRAVAKKAHEQRGSSGSFRSAEWVKARQ